MSPTLLEFVMVIVLIVIAWQISRAITPDIARWFRTLWREQDRAAEDEPVEPNSAKDHPYKEEHTNGTRH